jgi:hypothetical protein
VSLPRHRHKSPISPRGLLPDDTVYLGTQLLKALFGVVPGHQTVELWLSHHQGMVFLLQRIKRAFPLSDLP